MRLHASFSSAPFNSGEDSACSQTVNGGASDSSACVPDSGRPYIWGARYCTAESGVLYNDMEDLPAQVSTFLIPDGSYLLAAIPSLILSSLVVAKTRGYRSRRSNSQCIVSTFYNHQGSSLGNLPVAWISIQLQHTRAFLTGNWTDIDMGAL
jgi:hypothetical protein